MEFDKVGLVDRINIDLDQRQKDKLNHWIEQKIQSVAIDRTAFITRQKDYLSSYDDFITNTRKGEKDWRANYHMPLTLIQVNSVVSRLYNVLTSGDVTSYSPREGTDEAFVAPLKKLRDWYMWDYLNNYRGIKGVAYEVCQDVAKVGFGLLLKTWELKQRKTILVEENKEFQREVADLGPQVEELAKATDPNALPENKVDTKPYKEVEKILTVFEGTKLITVPFENAYFPNDIPESSNLDHPECVIFANPEMTLSEMKLKAKQGVFDVEGVEEASGETYNRNTSTWEQDIKEKRDALSGINSVDSSYTNQKRSVQYCFCTYDIDEDGIAEEIIVTRTDKGAILKITYLDRISPSGTRPIFKFDCFSKERQAYSRGVVEYMYPLQEEMDMNHNMRQDYLQLQTCPFFAYRSSSPLDKNKVSIAPGKGIPVDDVNQDIRMLTFQTNAHPLFQEEQYLWTLGDRINRNSPLAQGQMPETVGAQRSTSGVAAMLRQMDLEFKPVVELFALNWKKLEKSILEDLDFRVDPAEKARVLGPAVKEQFGDAGDFNSLIRITKMFDMKIDVASIVNSDEMKRNDASLLLQMVNTPTLANQMGIIDQKAIYNAWTYWLKAHGFDADTFSRQPQGVHDPLTLWQEIQIVYQGEIPPMSMMDNHDQKAMDLEAFMISPPYQADKAGQLTVSNVDDVMKATMQKHAQLGKAMQAQGNPNITGAQNQDQNQLMTGTAPQQGGQDMNKTTSRELGGGGGENSGQGAAGAGGEAI